MSDPDQSELIVQETLPEGEIADAEQPTAETEKLATPAKIHGYLVPNRHDRRRAAAKARRQRRKK